MLSLPEENYSVLKQTLTLLSYSQEEQQRVLEEFEGALFVEFAELIAKKLPQQERQNFIDLANSATTDEKRTMLEEKLFSWMNEREINSLFRKVADNLFADFLKEIYNQATGEQKKKLEEMFKVEALKG